MVCVAQAQVDGFASELKACEKYIHGWPNISTFLTAPSLIQS